MDTSGQVVDVLLAANDRLTIWVEGLMSSPDFEVQTNDVRGLIRDLLEKDDPNEAPNSTSKTQSGLHLFDEEEEQTSPLQQRASQDLLHAGLRTYVEIVQLSLQKPEQDYHLVLGKIEETLEKIMILRETQRQLV